MRKRKTPMGIKEILLKSLTVPGATFPFSPLLRDRAAILTLHRFRDDDHGVDGIDPVLLDEELAYLRRQRYQLVGLEDLFLRLAGDGPPLRRAVAFTLDDGYLEQATVAAPVFARYDCPATTFVTTGFLDGKIWFWWDRIRHTFLNTLRREVSVVIEGAEMRYSWEDDAGRRRALADFIAWCLRVPDALKHAAIGALARSAEVEIPSDPPPDCRPMSWDQLRDCERLGMSFGPHTVTHPILSLTTDEQSRREVVESWTRLWAEASHPVPVFSYPNGGWNDFGPREISVLEELDFLGAVVGVGGYADARAFRRDALERFRVRRFGYQGDLPHLVQFVSGVERLKQIIRREDVA
jgi:peptidoglycan/xylan/chitin deacetylase (PgdA/CDA1 family)